MDEWPGEVLVLEPSGASSQRARAFTRAALTRWSLEVLADDAEVVVSELVTNATLHAGTRLVLRLERLGDCVRVLVRDGDRSPVLLPVSVPQPAATLLDDVEDLSAIEAMLTASATTGRGLRLVASLAVDWGVEPEADGKTVWATLGRSSGPADLAVPDVLPLLPTAHPGPLVHLVAVPVRLALESDLHLDTLIREFQVMRAAGVEPVAETASLVEAARQILVGYARTRTAGRLAVREAAARGDRLVDVVLDVPDGAPAALAHLAALLETVDEHCRQGHLLALAAPPELQAFRAWLAAEVSRQVEGQPPSPCPFPVVPPDHEPPAPGPLSPEERAVLDALAAACSAAADGPAVAARVLDTCVSSLGATHASLCLLDRSTGQLEMVATLGYPAEVTAHWGAFPVAADVPAGEAVRTASPVVLRTAAERDQRYPALAGTPVLDDPSLVCVPLGDVEPPAAGVLNLTFARSRDFSGADLHLLQHLARVATPWLARAR